MMLSSKELFAVASRNLCAEQTKACLSPLHLDLYRSLGVSMFKLVESVGQAGWYLLVPLSKSQVDAIESGLIQSGVTIAEEHLREGLSLDAAGYYLMGIYADRGARGELNRLWSDSKSEAQYPIYAKGTTERGKYWMKREGFKVVGLNPIIQVLRR